MSHSEQRRTKDFLEFVSYLKKMAIINVEHCHDIEHKKTGDSGMKNTGKSSDAGSRSSGHNPGGRSHGGASNKASESETVTERSPDMEDRRTPPTAGKKSARSRRHASTRRIVRARNTICLTVLTLERTKLLSYCQST
jgi:hypothetical protein